MSTERYIWIDVPMCCKTADINVTPVTDVVKLSLYADNTTELVLADAHSSESLPLRDPRFKMLEKNRA